MTKPSIPLSLAEWASITLQPETISPTVEYVCDLVQDIVETGGGRHIIAMPPGSGKSTVARALASWFLAAFPHHTALHMTPHALLTKVNARYVHWLLKEHSSTLGVEVERTDSILDWKTSSQSRYRGNTLGDGLVGLRTHLSIFDGPYENDQVARSEKCRFETFYWYLQSLCRICPGGTAIVLMSNHHANDFASGLINRGQDWNFTNLFATAE